MQLHIANARFRERRTERALVPPGRLHADKRRPRPRDPRRKGLRGVGDPFDLPRAREANVDPSLRDIHSDKIFAAMALHRAPGRSENKKPWSHPGLHTGVNARLPLACRTATPAGPEIATVFKTNPRSERPPASPSSTKDGTRTMQPTRTPLPQDKHLIRNTILLRSRSSRRGGVDGRDEPGHDAS